MIATPALRVAPFASALLVGPTRYGIGMGHGYIAFGRDVIAVTRPGAPRMPNGIETALEVDAGSAASIGNGELACGAAVVHGGMVWDPIPQLRRTFHIEPAIDIDIDLLAGWGPGLTPIGDDILVGFVAGLALRGSSSEALRLAAHAAERTTALSATLLRLAAGGALPEPAHVLVEDGVLDPLLRFGATSGTGLIVGLALALNGRRSAVTTPDRVAVALPGRPMVFHIGTAAMLDEAEEPGEQ